MNTPPRPPRPDLFLPPAIVRPPHQPRQFVPIGIPPFPRHLLHPDPIQPEITVGEESGIRKRIKPDQHYGEGRKKIPKKVRDIMEALKKAH